MQEKRPVSTWSWQGQRIQSLILPGFPAFFLFTECCLFHAALFQALSSCAIPTCDYKQRLVDRTKEQQRSQAYGMCGSVFCPFVQAINADLAPRNLGNEFVNALVTAMSVPHGPYENDTFANVGALQDCIVDT
jgi:hypothetical protein